jgi:hypothetical protein
MITGWQAELLISGLSKFRNHYVKIIKLTKK